MEIGGMLKKNEMHLFGKFGEVGGHRLADKWLEPQNSPEIRGFSSLGILT